MLAQASPTRSAPSATSSLPRSTRTSISRGRPSQTRCGRARPAWTTWFFERLTEAKASEPGSAGCLVVNTVVAFGRDDADVTERTQRGWDDLADAFRVALRRAADKGEIGDSDETRVTLLLSVAHAINLAARWTGPDAARTYADAALALLDSWRSEQQRS